MKARHLNVALASAALLGVLGSSPVLAAGPSDSIWDDAFLRGLQRMPMMKMMDTNGDHKVSKEEFMHHAEMMFAKMDRNSDGVIDEIEWLKDFKNH